MQFKIFTIPLLSAYSSTEDMNSFLRGHKIIDVKKELIVQNDIYYWSFLITYIGDNIVSNDFEKKEMIDYKNVLEAEQFNRFAKMRTVRKQLSLQFAAPAYAIFTDAELAELAKLDELTLSVMQKVNGIGKKKIEKYGEDFLRAYFSEEQITNNPDEDINE